MEMIFLKHRLTPLLWEDLSETTGWYHDNDRWAEEALKQMQERGFSCLEKEVSADLIIRFSHDRFTSLAGAAERPLAIARAIAAVLSQPKGFKLLTGKRGMTLLTADI